MSDIICFLLKTVIFFNILKTTYDSVELYTAAFYIPVVVCIVCFFIHHIYVYVNLDAFKGQLNMIYVKTK